jgi:hypothetical protein
MTLKLSDAKAYQIAMLGKLYSPAKLHYNNRAVRVTCDVCQAYTEEAYGFDNEDYDLCKSCRINILKLYKKQMIENINTLNELDEKSNSSCQYDVQPLIKMAVDDLQPQPLTKMAVDDLQSRPLMRMMVNDLQPRSIKKNNR